jgi:Concanavalin A-like lectin/glucanases superfamily
MPIQFAGNQWMKTERPINMDGPFTIEAIVELEGNGHDPTIMALPAIDRWVPPYVCWRLGFQGDLGTPQFQVLFTGDLEPTSLTGPAIPLKQPVHISGVLDHRSMNLYLNGIMVAELKFLQPKTVAKSEQPCALGCRSATDNGGYFVGLIYEQRLFNLPLNHMQINTFMLRPYPLDNPLIPKNHCQGLWSAW